MRIDATNVLVAGGVLLIVGAGTWLVVGPALVRALWQIVVFCAVLAAVAAAMYGALYLAVGQGEGESPGDRTIDN